MAMTNVVETTREWRDGKRFLWMAALVVPLLPYVSFGIAQRSGSEWGWYFTPGLVFVLIPLLDWFVGNDGGNAPNASMQGLQDDAWYRYLTYLYLPLQYGSLLLGCWAWMNIDMGLVGKLGVIASLGTVSGIAINTAHELGHKSEKLEQKLAKIALAPSMYGHFFVEHNRGHHVRVSTPDDPATSRLGESFYSFLPRTVIGSAVSAWELEAKRWGARKESPWTWKNDVLNAWVLTVVLFGGLTLWFGLGVLPMLIAQGIIGFGLLEVVNYLEHYGLLRETNAKGHYVKVEPKHSWNSNRLITNLFLYQLQRHSDHHANPALRYQVLRHFENAPQLPAGYATMILFALVPPLWRSLMDKRVLAHYEGDITLANIHPPAREKYLAKYAKAA